MKRNVWIRPCKLIVILLLTAISAHGQLPAVTADHNRETASSSYSLQLVAELREIHAATLNSDYAFHELTVLTDKIGPRLSGSQQAQEAIDHVAGELQKLGLNVRLEKVMVPHWTRGDERAELVNFPGQISHVSQKIVLTALGGSVPTAGGGLDADVVVVNALEELEALDRTRIEGKIVVFNCRFDRQMAAEGFGIEAYRQASPCRVDGASAAARLGAVAVLVRSLGGANYRLPHTGFLKYAQDTPQIPAAAVAAEDADLIERLAREGPIHLRLILTPKTLPSVESYNVVADLKGSEHPEQIVLVSGHLDSWDLGTGAIDDAAGVAVAMQAVQILRRLNLRPKRTIRVVAWIGEEFGGLGGKAYVQEHATELANHIAAIESDHGAGHPLGFTFKAGPAIRSLLVPISSILQTSGAGLTRPTEDVETDISPLSDRGVPCFGLWQDGRTYFDYHHTAADTLDKIVPKELAENGAVMAVLAYALANAPGADSR